MERIELDAKLYFQFATMVFLITGVVFFFYVLFIGVDMNRLQVMSHPLFYLVMGFVCMGFYLGARKGVIE